MEALKYINYDYDFKSKQIRYYPKINKSSATQENKSWKDVDIEVSEEWPINTPNDSMLSN